ncbi:MAG: hypothetical protein IPM58_02940 [Nitrospira sp.]|nr:hypothetical protein [Nitrospira sp.]
MIAVLGVVALSTTISIAEGNDTVPAEAEFSGTLVKRVDGKQYQAQVFGKGDRLRLEYKYAIRTELGFTAIEIIRPDVGERWFVLPQQKQLLVLPITDETLSMRAELAGETSRLPLVMQQRRVGLRCCSMYRWNGKVLANDFMNGSM